MDLYQHRLITESIRLIENNVPANNFAADYSTSTFDKALITRTQLAELRYQVSPVILHLKQLFKFFCGLMCVLFLILGATSVSQLLLNDAGSKINFFWAIILFIVPNILSLIIWLFLYFTQRTFNVSWIASISLLMMGLLDKVQHKLTNKHPYYIPLFQFYFKHRFSEYMGKVQLSFISHLWWSCYLIGATLSLLLVLATHQVDFIWQTTILSENAFLSFTQWLTYLPNLFMLNVPTPSDVNLAGLDISNSLQTAQHVRVSWSNLLIFSLLIYALLPRIVLLIIFFQRNKAAQKQFKLDLSLPYYVQLKNLLHPILSTSFIKDADTQYPKGDNKATADKQSSHDHYNESLIIPDDAFPFAIELTSQYETKAKSHAAMFYSDSIINVLDSETQALALSALQLSHSKSLVLYVDVMRLPDRGWSSLVKQCEAQSHVQVYLILLGNTEPNEKTLTRIEGWIDIAAQANITSHYITYIANINSNNKQVESSVLSEEDFNG